jgi:hypothetical protein
VATRNLILVYNPNWMDGTDFENIANRIRQKAPDIDVYVTESNLTSFGIKKKASKYPTFIFSPGFMRKFKPRRGKVYCGQKLPKIEQMRSLERAGLPVPKWKLLEENTRLNANDWGAISVVKPSAWVHASQGRGVQYVKTENVRFMPPDEFPEDHCGRAGPMIVQKFINTGEYPSEHRVLCLFGAPLYAIHRICGETQAQPADKYQLDDHRDLTTFKDNKRFGFSHEKSEAHFTDNEEILALAGSVYHAVPEAPLQAVDVLREEATGKLYILEFNPGGNTWHFSSKNATKFPLIDGIRREDQLGGFSIAADVLIERTRAEAI